MENNKEWHPTGTEVAVIDKYLAERKAKEERQREAELEAEMILELKGFKKIFRFNCIWFLSCEFQPYNYYAEKDGKWVINITTGKKKKLKDDIYSRKFRKLRVGRLHKDEDGIWEFEEIKE